MIPNEKRIHENVKRKNIDFNKTVENMAMCDING